MGYLLIHIILEKTVFFAFFIILKVQGMENQVGEESDNDNDDENNPPEPKLCQREFSGNEKNVNNIKDGLDNE